MRAELLALVEPYSELKPKQRSNSQEATNMTGSGADRETFLGKLARRAAATIRRGALSVAGLGLVTAAAFSWTIIAGLAVAGVSCLLIDWMFER